MGGIQLKRLSHDLYKITSVTFNIDVCFEEYARYEKSLQEDIKQYYGRVLNFSNVNLYNNK